MSIEYVSGELFSNISDVSIYEYKYLIKYPNIKKNCNKIIYYNSNITNSIKYLIKTSNIFFVKTDYLNYFSNIILPHIDHKFILITHNSAKTSGKNINILNNKYLIKWFGQNMISHTKTYGIPLGLQNKQWEGSDFNICKKYKNNQKTNLLYFNFSIKTNKDRVNIEKTLLTNGFKKNNKKKWKEYIKDLSEHKFCISPEGKGVDCHRLWECIYVGCIPIVKKNKILYTYFKDLPILWVENFNEITKKYLLDIYENFYIKIYNFDKTRLEYWNNMFNSLLYSK